MHTSSIALRLGAALSVALTQAALALGTIAPITDPPTGTAPGASEWREPASLDEVASMIRRRLRDIRACLDASAVAAVHTDAWDVIRLARAAPALAEKESAKFPAGGAAALSKSADALAQSAERLHELADEEKVREAAARFDEVSKRFEAFAALVPARFFCPMHCEGDKVYSAPGECPVCGMKIKKITGDEYTVRVTPRGDALEATQPATLVFTIHDPAGAPVKNLETVHERTLHLLMVSEDLSWFAHEHPVLKSDGTFELEFTFPRPGSYTLFHDFTPPGMGMQVVPVTLTVPGAVPAPTPLTPDVGRAKDVDGYRVVLTTTGPIVTGAATKLRYLVMQGGAPVTDLEPFLGAAGHVIVVRDDRAQFVHSHPREQAGRAHAAHVGPNVVFEAYFKLPGRYRAWAQFQRAGKVFTVPFTFDVKPGKVHAEDAVSPK